MAEYIDKSALYKKIAQLEELARNSYLETPSNSPCYSRYMAQLNERTAFKHLIADFPAADVEPMRHGRWIEYQIPPIICCSNCDWATDVKEKNFNYCPNCGAKMDEGNE